ncbi:MAG: class IV adenylate cyclase [Deferrisomatales bacterium]
MRNVEAKARALSWEAFRARACALAGGPPEELLQQDTYFTVAEGYLKLRVSSAGAELIRYRRGRLVGDEPATSEYVRVPVAEPGPLREALVETLGVVGIVSKRRWVFHVGRSRIHLDEVENLGRFLEVEVILDPDEDARCGEAELLALLESLAVPLEDHIVGSYLDILLESHSPEAAFRGGRRVPQQTPAEEWVECTAWRASLTPLQRLCCEGVISHQAMAPVRELLETIGNFPEENDG